MATRIDKQPGRPISDADCLAESDRARISCERRVRRLLADLPFAFVEGEGNAAALAGESLRTVLGLLQPRKVRT